MVTPTVSKLINKVAWTARGFGRSAPIEVLYWGAARIVRSISSAFAVQSTLSHNTATQSLPTACWWKRPYTRTSRCRGVGVTTACRRGRAVADAAEPMVFLFEGGSLGSRNPQPGRETRGRSEAVS
jgi:hypothetical protein